MTGAAVQTAESKKCNEWLCRARRLSKEGCEAKSKKGVGKVGGLTGSLVTHTRGRVRGPVDGVGRRATLQEERVAITQRPGVPICLQNSTGMNGAPSPLPPKLRNANP